METSRAVDNTARVLNALRARPRTATQLSRDLDINRTVIHRMLVTLLPHGFVERRGDVYRLGPGLPHAPTPLDADSVLAARPFLAALADRTGETIALHVITGRHATALDRVAGVRDVAKVAFRVGYRNDLTRGANSRVLMAYSADAATAAVLSAAAAPGVLLAQWREARRAGFAVSRDELRPGVHGLAIPVLRRGAAEAAVCILVPSARGAALLRYLDDLHATAEALADL